MSSKTHTERAVQAVSQANAVAAKHARTAERKWWRQQLAKLIKEAEDLHGPGAVVSASQLVRLSEKRGGEP